MHVDRGVMKIEKEIEKLPRISFADLPTPIEELPNLSRFLDGPRIFIKRDDQIGLGIGGNKVRKLEFIMADAKRKNAHTVVTFGGIQSNHVRQTIAAARKVGLKAEVILFGDEPESYDGNLLLDKILGAKIHFVASEEIAGRMDIKAAIAVMKERALEIIGKEKDGYYIIPVGGYSPLGCIGYVNAVPEIIKQEHNLNLSFSSFIHASGSGGTQAGLVLGLKALERNTRVIGIDVANLWRPFDASIANMATLGAKALGLNLSFEPKEITVYSDYAGEGYAIPTPEGIKAIKLVARNEGIILDPVYTGKAMAGLIDLVSKGMFVKNETILFIHTGGSPALYPARDQLR